MLIIKNKFRINQNKKNQNKPSAAKFKPLKTSTLLRLLHIRMPIAYGDHNFSLGWGQKYWGGPGPPWPPPSRPPWSHTHTKPLLITTKANPRRGLLNCRLLEFYKVVFILIIGSCYSWVTYYLFIYLR